MLLIMLVENAWGRYQFDLNSNDQKETVRIISDGLSDGLQIEGETLSSPLVLKLPTEGVGAKAIELLFRPINSQWNILAVKYQAGITGAKLKHLSGRWLIYSFQVGKDLESYRQTLGPYYLQYKEFYPESYILRDYNLEFVDLDGNGVDDLVLKDGEKVQRVYHFMNANGSWRPAG